jgi:glycosyl hydrolase family 65
VIEATVAGVTAARCGGFGLAAAIDRAGRRRDLERAGADFVFGDVAELDLGISESDPWLLVFEGFDLAHETHREALPTLGNGYVATRGAMAWRVDDGVQLPGDLPGRRVQPADQPCGGSGYGRPSRRSRRVASERLRMPSSIFREEVAYLHQEEVGRDRGPVQR